MRSWAIALAVSIGPKDAVHRRIVEKVASSNCRSEKAHIARYKSDSLQPKVLMIVGKKAEMAANAQFIPK